MAKKSSHLQFTWSEGHTGEGTLPMEGSLVEGSRVADTLVEEEEEEDTLVEYKLQHKQKANQCLKTQYYLNIIQLILIIEGKLKEGS